MTDEIIEEDVIDHWTERFKVNGQISIYIVGDASILDDEVPANAHALGQVLIGEDDDGEPIYRQKLVREFVTGILDGEGDQFKRIHRLDEDTVGFLVMACDGATYRQKRFNQQDAEDWKQYADLVFGDKAQMLTVDEFRAMLQEDLV